MCQMKCEKISIYILQLTRNFHNQAGLNFFFSFIYHQVDLSFCLLGSIYPFYWVSCVFSCLSLSLRLLQWIVLTSWTFLHHGKFLIDVSSHAVIFFPKSSNVDLTIIKEVTIPSQSQLSRALYVVVFSILRRRCM